MSQCLVRISDKQGQLSGKLYGPFDDEQTASNFLKKRGWGENTNGVPGHWFVQSSRYSGCEAKIVPLNPPDELPGGPPWKDWPSIFWHN